MPPAIPTQPHKPAYTKHNENVKGDIYTKPEEHPAGDKTYKPQCKKPNTHELYHPQKLPAPTWKPA
jgi:hypothetical protein